MVRGAAGRREGGRRGNTPELACVAAAAAAGWGWAGCWAVGCVVGGIRRGPRCRRRRPGRARAPALRVSGRAVIGGIRRPGAGPAAVVASTVMSYAQFKATPSAATSVAAGNDVGRMAAGRRWRRVWLGYLSHSTLSDISHCRSQAHTLSESSSHTVGVKLTHCRSQAASTQAHTLSESSSHTVGVQLTHCRSQA